MNVQQGPAQDQDAPPIQSQQPAPDNTGSAGGGMAAAASAAGTPQPQAPQTAPVPSGQEPTVVRPVRRTGLAGIVDELRDALVGGAQTSSHVFQDDQGNKYIHHEPLTSGQKWLRIIGTAARGAGAGYAAGQGPGGGGRAFNAGLNVGDREAYARKKEEQSQQEEVKQDVLDKYNMIKLKHDVAAGEFELGRRQVQATENDVKFSQEQIDREHTLGSADLGVYKDAADLARVQKQDPNFWKNVYANSIVTVPEYSADGERKGIHIFLRTPGIGGSLVDKGTQVLDFVPGAKPNEPPKLVPRVLSIPATHDQVDAWNNAATAKYQGWQVAQENLADKAAQQRLRDEQVKTQKSEQSRNYAEAAKAKSETVPAGGNAGDEVNQDIASGLAEGRYIMGKDVPLRTVKDQTTAAQHTRNANIYSMQHFGLPYSPETIRQESKFAEAPHTQAFLSGIDRMVGTPGVPGQLDQVLDLAKKAGVGENAPVQTAKLWIKQKLGLEAAKNFEQGLSDTQTALGTLIGNPLLGSGESDLKLKTAQKQFGSDVTMSSLRGAVQTTKEILGRAQMELARNNRYIQKRYGIQYSPTPQPKTARPQTATGTAMGVDGKLHWTDGKVDLGPAE